jgi:hypothetical protein
MKFFPAFLLSLFILLSSAFGQTGSINVDENHNGHKIFGLPTPTAGNEAATKAYADSVGGGGGGGAAWGSITGTLSAQTDLQTALDNKQPIDADLTAIAALSGTHNIYYRSASNTWSTVTIGSGLDFTGATLSATGSGGNVSNTGTPLDNQVAVFTDATHVEGNSNLSFDSATNILSSLIMSATTGFRINGAAANRRILVGNATNFVQSAETYAVPGTSGNVMTSDGTNWTSAAPAAGGGVTSKVSGSDFSTSSTTLVNITGLTFAASANTKYEVDVLLTVQSTTTAGVKVGLAYSAAGAAGPYLAIGGTTSGVPAWSSFALGAASSVYTDFATAYNTVWIKALLIIGANTGNITVQILKVTSGTATVYIGSRMTVTQL